MKIDDNEIKKIASILEYYGYAYTDGDSMAAAKKWANNGMNSVKVRGWASVGVYDADTAYDLCQSGFTPTTTSIVAAELKEDKIHDDPIAALCSDELGVMKFVEYL